MSILFLSLAAVLILRGPLGRALAERLAGRKETSASDVDALRSDLEDVRHRLAEAEERLDFAERLLAKTRDPERIGPGRP